MALLNCAQGYFSLAIIRAQRVIFLRCKSYAVDEDDPDRGPNGMLLREIGASMSYYEDKLEGNGIGGIFVRSPHLPVDEIARKLEPLGLGPVLPVDPGPMFEPAEGARRPDDRLLQQLAPAIGAAVGRK